MGRDLRLYTETASKAQLVSYITSLENIESSSHLWNWPKGTVHYHWFEKKDYLSKTGVEITIFKVTEDHKKYARGNWALHLRNTYSATWHDVNMLNHILRTAKQKFGGDIYGDYGKNRYAPLWEDRSNAMSRGIAWVCEMTHHNISAVTFSLPKEIINHKKNYGELELVLKSHDPSRVIYNGLIPFLVSILEFYFKNIFIIGLKYDSSANLKIANHSQKVSFIDLQNNVDSEELIAESYTFQNMRQAKKAFNEWLDIDIEAIISTNTSNNDLWNKLESLIKYRHEIVHHLGVDTQLSRDNFIEQSKVVTDILETLVAHFSKKYEIEVEVM